MAHSIGWISKCRRRLCWRAMSSVIFIERERVKLQNPMIGIRIFDHEEITMDEPAFVVPCPPVADIGFLLELGEIVINTRK